MLELTVTGMTCQHCVHAVTEAVSALPGVLGVAVDLGAGAVRVTGEPDPAAVRAAIEEEGYTVG
jgi:copper chaperone CopZ